MRPSDSHVPSASAAVPLAFGLPSRRALVLCHATRAPTDARVSGDWSPAPRIAGITRWRDVGLPGSWAVRASVPRPITPPGATASRPLCEAAAVAFRPGENPGHPGCISFRGCHAAAHTPACLRIAGLVAEIRRKARFRLVGLTLPGWDSHPLNDKPNFVELPPALLLSDQPFLVALPVEITVFW
jgi:hypothetical protein